MVYTMCVSDTQPSCVRRNGSKVARTFNFSPNAVFFRRGGENLKYGFVISKISSRRRIERGIECVFSYKSTYIYFFIPQYGRMRLTLLLVYACPSHTTLLTINYPSRDQTRSAAYGCDRDARSGKRRRTCFVGISDDGITPRFFPLRAAAATFRSITSNTPGYVATPGIPRVR